MRRRTDEERAIQLVVAAINRATGTAYRVTDQPDRANRNTPAVDALAEAPGATRFAIEHTKLETLANQTRDSAWFNKAIVPLEEELRGEFPFRLELWVPYDNVVPGQDWDRVRASLRSWLVERARALPEERTEHRAAGVPFRFVLVKRSGEEPRFGVGRLARGDDRAEPLVERMHVALDHKREELARSRAAGAATVLVLESEDVILAATADLNRAFIRATHERPRGWLDQVWLVRSGAGESPYCLVGPDDLMAAVNPANLRLGRREQSATRGSGAP